MGWRERLLTASFRGVRFFVERDSNQSGRKTVVHEFPERDLPYAEDLGRDTRVYNISGYLVGDDYLTQRDSLLNACENKSGAGLLIHPYFGALDVVCQRVRTIDNANETNMLRLGLTFVESGLDRFPVFRPNTRTQNSTNRLAALDVAKDTLAAAYDLTRVPINKVKQIRANIRTALGIVEDARLTVKSVASYRRRFEALGDDVETLLNSPRELADAFADLLMFGTFPSGLFPAGRSDEYNEDNEDSPATSGNSRDQFNELQEVWDFAPGSDTVSSDAFNSFFNQAVICAAAGLITEIEFDSVNEAEEFRDILVQQVNGILEQEADSELSDAFRSLRTGVIEDVNRRAVNLSRLVELTLVESAPALVLSYNLYGSTDSEQDIIDRNKVENPGFVPGGEPIEVLIDV